MKILKRKTLIYKFLVFIIPFIFLSIAMASAILSFANYAFFRKTINQDYRNIVKSSAGEIRSFMENAQKNLNSLAIIIAATKLDQWQKEISLTAFLHTNPEFMTIDIYSPQGDIIAATMSEDLAPAYFDKKIFEKALAGQTTISSVQFSKDNLPIVYLVVPIYRHNQVEQILWGVLKVKSVWDILETITIGDTGQVYVMDLAGRYIAHREIARVFRESSVEDPEILQQLREADLPVEWFDEKNGIKNYNLGVYVPGLDWVIALSQPVGEIYAYLYHNIYWAAGMTFIVCLIAMMLGWNWVKKFLAPVHTLHRQVKIIGDGNLDQKVTTASEDEIGNLANAFNDMSDSLKKYLHREIESAKALTHAKNLAFLGEASSKVTHEVGNFLNNIDMVLAGLKAENLSPRSENILKILKNESGRVKEFIQNFLQFAKKPELRLQKIPLDLIIKEVISVFQPVAEKRKICIALDWPPGIPTINIDPSLMHQVFNNLVKNSMEAMTDSGNILISGAIDAESLLISFSDSGRGIDSTQLAHIFEPFFTTKGKKGTGLGLAVVASIIESHRGTILCKSEVGKGAIFIIRLPLN